jgi:pimeloyl-ACP methyl ester carboxylesterase
LPNVFVERHGRGPRVFFALHGWGGDRRTFAPLARHMPESASLYAADLPGCGDSPRPNVWTVGCVVDEIVRAVRRIGGGRVTLVGNCGGAVLALLAARELEDAIERVSIIDPFAYLPRYFRLFNAGEFGRRAYDATFANPVGRWLTNQSLRGRRAGAADLTAAFAKVDHESARRYLALYEEVGGVEIFRDMKAPVEIAYGERTFGAVKRSLNVWREVLPHVRVRELKGAGHQPFIESPAQSAEFIFRGVRAGESE